jgi:hypothetical protein
VFSASPKPHEPAAQPRTASLASFRRLPDTRATRSRDALAPVRVPWSAPFPETITDGSIGTPKGSRDGSSATSRLGFGLWGRPADERASLGVDIHGGSDVQEVALASAPAHRSARLVSDQAPHSNEKAKGEMASIPALGRDRARPSARPVRVGAHPGVVPGPPRCCPSAHELCAEPRAVSGTARFRRSGAASSVGDSDAHRQTHPLRFGVRDSNGHERRAPGCLALDSHRR